MSRWHDEFTSRLAAGAREALEAAGAEGQAIQEFYVPGAFELPLGCLMAARSRDFDAVIALGVVIRGDTPHFEYVASEASRGIMQASMDTGVPVAFGVITADTAEQVEARCGARVDNKGYEAALAAVEMAALVSEFAERSASKI